ncbi:LysR substrate-binding domain-containing protein [Streptomyces sp. NPDC051597]|uniref:LysR substrate-binding domain-containing protein n=1 Tax=Streptomyces sp. NPDC051597 TaxID=3155049 RepID=UPI0034218F73
MSTLSPAPAQLTREDLATTTLITFAAPVLPSYWQDYHCPRQIPSGQTIPHLVAGYGQEALAMVSAGRGVVFTSARAEQYYARPDTVWLPFPQLPRFEYVPIWPPTSNTPHLQAFLRTVTEAPRLPHRSTSR